MNNNSCHHYIHLFSDSRHSCETYSPSTIDTTRWTLIRRPLWCTEMELLCTSKLQLCPRAHHVHVCARAQIVSVAQEQGPKQHIQGSGVEVDAALV